MIVHRQGVVMKRRVTLRVAIDEVLKSDTFDLEWYLRMYEDVSLLEVDPVHHYLWLGQRLNRSPAPNIEPGADILSSLGLAVDRIDPPSSLLGEGAIQRTHRQAFEVGYSSDNNPNLTRPCQEILILRAQSKAKASSEPFAVLFDARWYADAYGSQIPSDCDPWDHFVSIGRQQGLQPNEYFSPTWYLQANPDVASAQIDASSHYVSYGASEGRSCGPFFLPGLYEAQLSEPIPSNVIALAHFLAQPERERFVISPEKVSIATLNDQLGLSIALDPIRLAIGIVVYKQSIEELRSLISSANDAIYQCGQSVLAQIFIVDNAETLSVDDLPNGVEFLESSGNVGFGCAQNRLMRRAFSLDFDVYIGANPDGAFHPDSIMNMLKMSQRHAGNALIEAVQFPEEHPKFYHPETLVTDWCSGACFLISRKIFAETEGFDPEIFMYCEDVDLSWRVRLKGFKTLTCPTAYFFHDVSDRGYNPRIWMQMLIAGRYLAYKWRNEEFRQYAERELVSCGFFRDFRDLPNLDGAVTVRDAMGIPNFSKMFSFGSTRW